jgi:hypothetical protein
MKLIDRYASQIQADQHIWAAEHANANPHLFELLPINPEHYPHQEVSEHTITGSPLDPEIVDGIAADIEPRYPEISWATQKNEKPLTIMGEILDSKQNVVFGTDHVELVDIAFLTVKAATTLKRQGYVFDTSIIVNGMVKFLGVKMKEGLIPATDLLTLAFDEIYLNIPNTTSGKNKMTIPKRVITSYNHLVLDHGIEKRLKKSRAIGRAMLLGTALPGTVNKPLDIEKYRSGENGVDIPADKQGSTLVIGRANTGMLRFMDHGLTMLATTRLEPGDVHVQISDIPLSVHTKDKLDTAMQKITAMQQALDPEHYHVYDVDGSLPVLR